MRKKMIKHGIAIIGVAILIFLSVASATAPSETKTEQPKEIVYQEITAKDLQEAKNYMPGQGFKIIDGIEYKYGDELFGLKSDAQRLRFSTSIIGTDNYTINARIAGIEKFTFYISVKEYGTGNAFGIDRIEGLRSLDEVRAEVAAQKEAERLAQEEAKQRAEAEARRRALANFIIAPSDFEPAGYTKADLFDAVAASEKLSANHQYWGTLDFGPPSRKFVSDVLFVSQNGTDITFRTADNAIRKTMKVNSRTNLTVGQRVRVYYTVYRILDWTIEAIERL
jgi:hypothetical protein